MMSLSTVIILHENMFALENKFSSWWRFFFSLNIILIHGNKSGIKSEKYPNFNALVSINDLIQMNFYTRYIYLTFTLKMYFKKDKIPDILTSANVYEYV